MPVDYEIDPHKIEQESFRQIRELTRLDSFDREQQQVAMRVVHSLGQPDIVGKLRFSESVREFRDESGELVVRATTVGVITSQAVED